MLYIKVKYFCHSKYLLLKSAWSTIISYSQGAIFFFLKPAIRVKYLMRMSSVKDII